MPDFRGDSGFFGHVLSGWSISGTTILQSGTPYTVYTNAAFQPIIANGVVTGILPASGDYNADGFNLDYPNVTYYSTPTSRQAYLNGVFSPGQVSQPALGEEGNEKSNQLQNPGFANTDAALFKDTKLYERLNLQLRFEVFNVFDRPNLMGVDANLADSTFGRVTSQYNPRWLEVAAKFTF
ncbi:MAG TPA: hypothetical protein VHZ55_21580 [Bryobacteraceae bacterium]|nr:hypothetical protein [Bryobacteraceae bacterium]